MWLLNRSICPWLAALALLLCGQLAIATPELPVELRLADGTVVQDRLLLTDQPGATMVGADGQTHLSLRAEQGRSARFTARWREARELEAGHMYQVTLSLRRAPGLVFYMRQGDHLLAPPIDYLIAPIWEDVTVFMVVPPDSDTGAFQLNLTNRSNLTAGATMDLRRLLLVDLGAVQPLAEPRRIGSWADLQLAPGELPATYKVVHDGGPGVYRFRANVEAESALSFTAFLSQGEDATLFWARSTEYTQRIDVEAGLQPVECLFYVGDRRFILQRLRFRLEGRATAITLNDIRLDQIATAPAAAAKATPQTRDRR